MASLQKKQKSNKIRISTKIHGLSAHSQHQKSSKIRYFYDQKTLKTLQVNKKQQQIKNLSEINDKNYQKTISIRNKFKSQQKYTLMNNRTQLIKKQINKKIKKLPPLNQSQPKPDTSINILPQYIRLKYKMALMKGNFIDQQFPHKQQSLGGKLYQQRIRPLMQSLKWMKPAQFLGDNFQLFQGIDPDDIKQGILGVCYCLATISSLAKIPQRIKAIFPFYDKKIGFYVLKFYTEGKLRYVIIDDYFPCNQQSKQPYFSKPIGKQIWVLLIQKAWAKIVGSYFASQKMTPDQFIQDLTAGPAKGGYLKGNSQILDQLCFYQKKGYPIMLTTGDKLIKGIVNFHAYSLLDIIYYKGQKIYKVRNPWGKFQWNGYYGIGSTAWTQQLKKICNFLAIDDGIFFLSQNQLLQAFTYYSIGFDEPDYKYTYVQFQSQIQQDKYFKIKHLGGKAAIRISQPFHRLVQDSSYKVSPVVIELGRIQGNKVVFMSEGGENSFVGGKSVYVNQNVFVEYPPGQYFLRVRMQWQNPQKYRSALLSIFSSNQVKFQSLSQQIGKNLWQKMIIGFLQGKQQRIIGDAIVRIGWMKNQLVCYSRVKKGEGLLAKWLFKHDELQNCFTSLNKFNQQILLCPFKNNESVGTLERKYLNKPCKSSYFQFSLEKIQNY